MDHKEPITEKLQDKVSGGASLENEEVNQEALKALGEKRKTETIKAKKRRQKAFLLAELLGLGIIVVGFALYLVFLGGAVLLVGLIMAGIFCCMSLPLIYLHHKNK